MSVWTSSGLVKWLWESNTCYFMRLQVLFPWRLNIPNLGITGGCLELIELWANWPRHPIIKTRRKKDVCLASDCISGTLVMKIRCPQLSPNNYAFFCFMSTVHPSNIIRVRVWKHDRESDLETHFKILKFTRARMCFAQLSPNNCAFFAYFRIDKILSCPDYRLQNAQD